MTNCSRSVENHEGFEVKIVLRLIRRLKQIAPLLARRLVGENAGRVTKRGQLVDPSHVFLSGQQGGYGSRYRRPSVGNLQRQKRAQVRSVPPRLLRSS